MQYGLFLIFLLLGLSGCALYHSEPLAKDSAFSKSPADIKVYTAKLDVPSLRSYPFNAADGLDMTETAILAVLNNPTLKLARDDAAVSHAQAFAAGLLPDPQFTPAEDLTMPSGPGLHNAYTLGLSYDISALIKFPSALRAEHAEYKKIDLTLLWQELQTISQARLLFAKTLAQDKMLAILKDYHDWLEKKRSVVLAAVKQGQLSMDTASPLLAAYLDMTGKFHDAERQSAKNHRDLNALLGLAPDTKLQLIASSPPKFDMAALPAIRTDLPKRRPDLLALKSGYAVQDEHYWQAILAQFPLVNASVNRARDNGGINSRGFALTINLPLFNRNQGNIAIEKATRQKLHDEYQIRLNQAYAEITGIAEEYVLTRAQYTESQASLAQWKESLANADNALAQHHIDLFTYANLRSTYITKEIENTTLAENLREGIIALDTLSAQDVENAKAQKEPAP